MNARSRGRFRPGMTQRCQVFSDSIAAVRGHERGRIAGAALLLAGCLPGPGSDILLTERVEIVSMGMELVEPGPASVGLLPIPADRVQSEALPGDRVRMTALAVDHDGQVDLEAQRARWLLSWQYFPFPLEELHPCDLSVQMETSEVCEVGVGASVELTVPPLHPDLAIYQQRPNVLLIVGTGGVSTEECIERATEDLTRLTWDCVMARRSITLGPTVRLAGLMAEQGIPLDPDDAFDLPEISEISELPELPEEVPNFAPQTPWMALSRPGELIRVWPGERAQVAAGVRYDVGAVREPRDSQTYISVGFSGFHQSNESVAQDWYATEPVLGGYPLELIVPDDVTTFTLFVVAIDSRSSQSWSIFEFDVVPP